MIFARNLSWLIRDFASVTEFSNAIGIERSKVSRLLNGTTTPSTEMLAKICDFFDVDANILFVDLSAKAEPAPREPHKFYTEDLHSQVSEEIKEGNYFSYYSTFTLGKIGKNLVRFVKKDNVYQFTSWTVSPLSKQLRGIVFLLCRNEYKT